MDHENEQCAPEYFCNLFCIQVHANQYVSEYRLGQSCRSWVLNEMRFQITQLVIEWAALMCQWVTELTLNYLHASRHVSATSSRSLCVKTGPKAYP